MTGSIEPRLTGADPAVAAARHWWDARAAEYQAAHEGTLGRAQLTWGPEGWTEADFGLLGDLAGRHVVEVGCGAGQGARYVWSRGAGLAVGVDIAHGQLLAATRLDRETQLPGFWIEADAARLPLADDAFDVAFAAYGALQFVSDPVSVHRQVARVLRPGGRWVWSVTHPIRWAFLDDPTAAGLKVIQSYFDRTPYREFDDRGLLAYQETHRTLTDHIRDLRAAGFDLLDFVEPEWPPDQEDAWDGWSPTRGRLIPGTAIFVCQLREQGD